MEARVVVDTLEDKVAEVEVLTLSKKLGEKMTHTLHHTRLLASRGGEWGNWRNSHLGEGLSMVGTLPNVHVEEKA